MNSKKSKLFVLVGLGVTAITGAATYFAEKSFSGCVLSKKELQARWGDQTFDSLALNSPANDDPSKSANLSNTLDKQTKFADLLPQERTFFVWWIVARGFKSYVNKTPEQIVALFGTPDGTFSQPGMPSYLLLDTSNNATWNLVFATNQDNKVKETFVWREKCQ